MSKKGETNNNPNKINLLGASGIESSMRSVLELRKDQNDGTIRTLKVTKGNYVSEEFKKRVLKMQQRENFTYECIDFKDQPERKQTDELIQIITELNKSGLTIREIETKLNDDGIKIGKTKIHQIVTQIKQKETVCATKNQDI